VGLRNSFFNAKTTSGTSPAGAGKPMGSSTTEKEKNDDNVVNE
jgi:hypothetical protein